MGGYVQDRWIWMGMGIAFAIGSLALHITSFAPEVKAQDESKTQHKQKARAVPAVLSLKTLRTLIDSPNPNIRQMAIDLVVKRMKNLRTNIEVMQAIKADSVSADEDTRRQARLTLRLLQLDDDIPFVRSPTWSEASSSSPHEHDGDPAIAVVPSPAMPVAGWTAIPRERPPASDSDIRRRRREAVVLHEGTGDVNEDDIIRPSDIRDRASTGAYD